MGGDESIMGLVIPSSGSGGGGEIGGYQLSDDDRGSIRRRAEVGGSLDEEEGFNLDPGFTVDEDGNLIITGDHTTPQTQLATRTPLVRVRSDSAASGLIRQELREGLEAGEHEAGIPSMYPYRYC